MSSQAVLWAVLWTCRWMLSCEWWAALGTSSPHPHTTNIAVIYSQYWPLIVTWLLVILYVVWCSAAPSTELILWRYEWQLQKKAFKFWHRISGHQHSLLIKWKCPSGKWKLHHYMKGLLFRMWSMLFLYCYVCVVHVHVLDTLCLCRDTTSHRIVSVSTVWGRFLRCIDLSGWRCACTL